jgi:hypothetical protein
MTCALGHPMQPDRDTCVACGSYAAPMTEWQISEAGNRGRRYWRALARKRSYTLVRWLIAQHDRRVTLAEREGLPPLVRLVRAASRKRGAR